VNACTGVQHASNVLGGIHLENVGKSRNLKVAWENMLPADGRSYLCGVFVLIVC